MEAVAATCNTFEFVVVGMLFHYLEHAGRECSYGSRLQIDLCPDKD